LSQKQPLFRKSVVYAFALYPRHHSRVPHISLVFREMWDTAGLALSLCRVPQIRTGALRSHQRCPDFLLSSASRDRVCGFLSKKAA
jgi:hypothetical protein